MQILSSTITNATPIKNKVYIKCKSSHDDHSSSPELHISTLMKFTQITIIRGRQHDWISKSEQVKEATISMVF